MDTGGHLKSLVDAECGMHAEWDATLGLGSAGGPASVEHDRLAGDQRGGGGGEEDEGAGDFVGRADAVQGGDALLDVRPERRV